MLRRGGAMTLFFKGVHAPNCAKPPYRTRQKEKSKKWRVRSRPKLLQTTTAHTPKRKKQEMTCAEPPQTARNYRIAHVKKKKARNDVCGGAPSYSKLPCCTRQKEKSKKWRVRRRPTQLQTTASHTPKSKKARNDVCGAAPSSPEAPKTRAIPPQSHPAPKKLNIPCNIFQNYASNL